MLSSIQGYFASIICSAFSGTSESLHEFGPIITTARYFFLFLSCLTTLPKRLVLGQIISRNYTSALLLSF